MPIDQLLQQMLVKQLKYLWISQLDGAPVKDDKQKKKTDTLHSKVQSQVKVPVTDKQFEFRPLAVFYLCSHSLRGPSS